MKILCHENLELYSTRNVYTCMTSQTPTSTVDDNEIAQHCWIYTMVARGHEISRIKISQCQRCAKLFNMCETTFNMCSFIRPSFVVEMLQSIDPYDFGHLQLFAHAEETEYKYEQLQLPLDPTVRGLKAVFGEIQSAHK